jgi:hypothetical protein
MVLELNEVKTVAQSQRFVFENLVIQRQGISLSANVQFAVFNEKNERIATQNYQYQDEAFNEFWTNFNSGKFLYDELVKKSMLPIAVDAAIESDFVYVAPQKPKSREELIEELKLSAGNQE